MWRWQQGWCYKHTVSNKPYDKYPNIHIQTKPAGVILNTQNPKTVVFQTWKYVAKHGGGMYCLCCPLKMVSCAWSDYKHCVTHVYIELKKSGPWKCLVKHCEWNLHRSMTEFLLQVCTINLPGQTGERLCTFVFRLLLTVLLNWAKSSAPEMKYYDESLSEACEGTFTPVLLWQPGGPLSLPPTASYRRKKGGHERGKVKMVMIRNGKRNKTKSKEWTRSDVRPIIKAPKQ